MRSTLQRDPICQLVSFRHQVAQKSDSSADHVRRKLVDAVPGLDPADHACMHFPPPFLSRMTRWQRIASCGNKTAALALRDKHIVTKTRACAQQHAPRQLQRLICIVADRRRHVRARRCCDCIPHDHDACMAIRQPSTGPKAALSVRPSDVTAHAPPPTCGTACWLDGS